MAASRVSSRNPSTIVSKRMSRLAGGAAWHFATPRVCARLRQFDLHLIDKREEPRHASKGAELREFV
jgi:hypothetical protein